MQQQSGNPAVRQGLTFGLILGVIGGILGILSIYTNVGVIGILSFIVGLVLYGVAGFRASATTGKVPTGLVAGLLTGLIGTVVGAIIQLPFVFLNLSTLVSRANAAIDQVTPGSAFHYTDQSYITITLGGTVFGVIVAGVIGLAVGAIGGAIGKGRASVPMQAYQESMYQGIQQPGTYPPPNAYAPPGSYAPPGGYQQPQPGAYPPPPQQYPPQQPPQYPQQ